VASFSDNFNRANEPLSNSVDWTAVVAEFEIVLTGEIKIDDPVD
jgi:hypothetical protein